MAKRAEELPTCSPWQPHSQHGPGNWGWDVGLKFLLIPLEGILWIRQKTEHEPSKEQSCSLCRGPWGYRGCKPGPELC